MLYYFSDYFYRNMIEVSALGVNHTQLSLLEANPTTAIPYIILTSCALLLGTAGNVLILFTFITHPLLRKVGNEFVVNLAAADLVVSCINSPFCLIGKRSESETCMSTKLVRP